MNSITLSLLVGFAMATSALAETSCPDNLSLLRSAFEVAIDLNAPTKKQISCSQQDNKILEDLVEHSMNEATRKIAEWKLSDQFKDGDSKVCNSSQQEQQSGRKLNQQDLNYGIFRYYGGMRCRLCSRDDDDAGVIRTYKQILKFDKTSQSIKCHRYLRFNDLTEQEKIRRSKVLNPPKEKSHYTIDVHAPSMVQEFNIAVHLGLGKKPSWTGQHIYIILNGQTFDLGPFRNGPVVKKQSPGINLTNEVGWYIKPGWEDPSMHLVEMFIPRSFYSKTSMLKVEILFGEQTASPRHVGVAWPFQTNFGTILPASECEAKNPLVPNRNRKLKRRTISSPASPVSSPTSPVLSPVSSPQSSPLAAPVKHTKGATAKKKKNHRGERNNQAKSSTSKRIPPKRQIDLRKKMPRKKMPRKKSNVMTSRQRTGTKKKKSTSTRRMKRVSVPSARSGPVKGASKKKKSPSTRQKTKNRSPIPKTMRPKQNRSPIPKKMRPKQNRSPMRPKRNRSPMRPKQNRSPIPKKMKPKQNRSPMRPKQNRSPMRPKQNRSPMRPKQNMSPMRPKQNRSPIPKKMRPKQPMMTKKKVRNNTPKQRMTMRKKKKEQPTDKGIMPPVVDEDEHYGIVDLSLRRGKEKSVSTSSRFQSQVKSTLSTILEDKIKSTLRPGHCMYAYAKIITAEIELVPKLGWEERLPACDGEQ